jgi:hypothetical protein
VSRRSVQGRAALAAVSLVTVAALSGCAAGFDAETINVDSPGEGVSGKVGDVKIRGALLADVEDEPGSGVLVMGVVNEGGETDALTEVRLVDGEPADLGSSVSLPPNQLVQFGTAEVAPGATYGGTYVLNAPTDTFSVGGFVPVSFTFREAGSVTLDLLILPPTDVYATVTPTAQPTATATTGARSTEAPEGASPSPEEATPEEATPEPTAS